MPTNQQVIDRALQELGYIEYGAAADATDAADALDAMNDMAHAWKYASKDLNWFTQDTLGDTAPLPKWCTGPFISCLARRLGTVFNILPSQQLAIDADRAEKLIARTLINLNQENADMSHMPLGTARTGANNIEQDNA